MISRRRARRPDMRLTVGLLAAAALGTIACASEPTVGADTDAVPRRAAFGAACAVDSDCQDGLLCLAGDFAPKPFCTLPCATAKAYCEPDVTKGVQGFCVELPPEFKGTIRRFCAPVCVATPDCKALDPMWSSCNKPSYKGVKLANELPTRVCLSTESHGQVLFDPITCDWESKVTDPKFNEAKQVCKGFCTVLSACKFWDKAKEPLECCGQRCFQLVTPEGKVDNALLAKRKCYINTYAAVSSTTKACDGAHYGEQCFVLGDPHAP